MTTITFCLIHSPPKGTCHIATRMTFLKLSHSYPWPPELWLNFLACHLRCFLRWPCLFLQPPVLMPHVHLDFEVPRTCHVLSLCLSKGFPSSGRLLLHLTKTQFTLSFLQKVISFFSFFFYFGVCHVTYRTLVPWPGIESVPHAFGTWNPNHWTAREIPESHSLNLIPTPNTHSTEVVSPSSKLPKHPSISLMQHLSHCCNHRFTSLSPPPVSNLRAYQGLWVAMRGHGLLC